jgi:hypothetical protein
MAKKATSFQEIDQAIQFNASIAADHPFFTDFNEVRGSFSQQQIFRSLNVRIVRVRWGITFGKTSRFVAT